MGMASENDQLVVRWQPLKPQVLRLQEAALGLIAPGRQLPLPSWAGQLACGGSSLREEDPCRSFSGPWVLAGRKQSPRMGGELEMGMLGSWGLLQAQVTRGACAGQKQLALPLFSHLCLL